MWKDEAEELGHRFEDLGMRQKKAAELHVVMRKKEFCNVSSNVWGILYSVMLGQVIFCILGAP